MQQNFKTIEIELSKLQTIIVEIKAESQNKIKK